MRDLKLAATPKTRALAEPSLVGREKELEQLGSLLNSVINGKGKTVFISGEAGCGKTRLVTEFLKRAKNEPVTVLTGWCLSNAAVPYFPFFEAFNTYFTGETRDEVESGINVTDWLGGPDQAKVVGKPQGISPQVWKDQTFAAVAKTILAISAGKPVILFIDDVHWADSASLALIHYIARVISSERVFLLATFRSEQLTPDAEGRPHPLIETMRLMRREDLYKEIKVANLSLTTISELAKNMLGGEIQRDFALKLAEESQGNALFIVESIRMLHERNGLTVEQEEWRLASDELMLPDKIKDLILQRLSVLPHNQKRILEAASVIGEKFDTELLASTLGQDHLEVADALDMIERSTSLVYSEGVQYRFDHARSRDAIYGEISPTLKRAYHGKVAEKLESAGKDSRLPLSELAFHYAHAGNKEKAVKFAMVAGQDELEKWSNAQAIEHFSYALANLPEELSEERRRALEGLGDAYAGNSMFGEAIKTFDKLAALETGRLRLRAIRKAMDAAYFIWTAHDLILKYAKEAKELGVDDRLEMARILVNRGRAFGLAASGNLEMDLADSDAALQVFEEEYSLPDVATALWRGGIVCIFFEGLKKKGLSELLRSVAIFKELGDARKEIEAKLWTGYGFFLCFLHSEAICEYTDVTRMGEGLGMFAELIIAYNGLAGQNERDGKLAEAVSCSLKSIEYSKKTDIGNVVVGSSYGNLVRLYAKLGDLKHADEWRALEIAGANDRDTGFQSHYLFGSAVAEVEGVRLAAKGQWNESNKIFEELLDSKKTGRFLLPYVEYNAISDFAWALEKQGRFEEAKVQRDRARRLLQEAEVKFGHADLHAHLMVCRQVAVGEEFEIRFDFVNMGRKPALLLKVENLTLDDFKVLSLPPWCSTQDNVVEMEKREIGPFQVDTAKLILEGQKEGTFSLNPQTIFVNHLGETKTFRMNTVNITVLPPQPKVHPARVSTGTFELDSLLRGGIPENYSVILTASSSNEKEQFIKRFLETAAQTDQPTLFMTTEATNAKTLAETFPPNFSLFICSPQAELITENLAKLHRLKGVDNLTEIDIALAKYFRTLNPSKEGARVACVQIISDVLLQHHAVVTRKWLSSLLANLKSKGFTTLAVIDPSMHPPEEVNAILDLFDGEIEIAKKETAKGLQQVLRVRKLYNQKYMEDELILGKGLKP